MKPILKWSPNCAHECTMLCLFMHHPNKNIFGGITCQWYKYIYTNLPYKYIYIYDSGLFDTFVKCPIHAYFNPAGHHVKRPCRSRCLSRSLRGGRWCRHRHLQLEGHKRRHRTKRVRCHPRWSGVSSPSWLIRCEK